MWRLKFINCWSSKLKEMKQCSFDRPFSFSLMLTNATLKSVYNSMKKWDLPFAIYFLFLEIFVSSLQRSCSNDMSGYAFCFWFKLLISPCNMPDFEGFSETHFWTFCIQGTPERESFWAWSSQLCKCNWQWNPSLDEPFPEQILGFSVQTPEFIFTQCRLVT